MGDAVTAWLETVSFPFDLPRSRSKRILLAVRTVAVVALIVAAVATPGFLTRISLFSLLTTMAFIGCVAIGMTFITLSGNAMSFALGATLSATAPRRASSAACACSTIWWRRGSAATRAPVFCAAARCARLRAS